MWDQLTQCIADGGGRVAFCIPWPDFLGGPTLAIYWYGILASVGIFLGAWYASKHIEMEGDDPDLVWDALLWLLIPALLGARLWYVGQSVLAGSRDFDIVQAADLLKIFNSRLGGMNIFGGAIFGLIALIVYSRSRKINGWLLADAGMMGLLIGQAIGRIGNFINKELYGPPTGSTWFGMTVPADRRFGEYQDTATYPDSTLFHPTMFYEMAWLLLAFGVIYYLFRRSQKDFLHGLITGFYLIASGLGRFIFEFLRMDQPKLPGSELTYSQIFAVLYIAVGVIIVLDRWGYISLNAFFKVFFKESPVGRPQTRRQRDQAFEALVADRKRQERASERNKVRDERRKQRQARQPKPTEPQTPTTEES
jgi:phosphatidylglycerol:prolipoprotein diacylglycerol transferase